jgi:3-oxoacyl-[acyl-carrier protein] reductase
VIATLQVGSNPGEAGETQQTLLVSLRSTQPTRLDQTYAARPNVHKTTSETEMSRKIALVFGGSRGIGAATVQALARDHDVAFTYVTSPPAAIPSPGGARVAAYRVEITDPAAVAEVFADVARDRGRAPDCVVANAGINVPTAPVAQFEREHFRRLVEVNIVGAFNILQEASRRVADNGSIIALTTSLVRVGAPGFGPYSATKAAAECLVRSLSK